MESFSVTPLAIPGVLLVQPRKFADHRGYFVGNLRHREFARLGIANDFGQDNQSFSVRLGTVRGLRFSCRLIRRPNWSACEGARYTMSRWICGVVHRRSGVGAYTLTAEKGDQLFVPCGFAHGFAISSSK